MPKQQKNSTNTKSNGDNVGFEAKHAELVAQEAKGADPNLIIGLVRKLVVCGSE